MPTKKKPKKQPPHPANVTVDASTFYFVTKLAAQWYELCKGLDVDATDTPVDIMRKLKADKDTDATQDRVWAKNWESLCDFLALDPAGSYDNVRSVLHDAILRSSHFLNLVDTLAVSKDMRTAGGVLTEMRAQTDFALKKIGEHLGMARVTDVSSILEEISKDKRTIEDLSIKVAQYETDAAKWVVLCGYLGRSPAISVAEIDHEQKQLWEMASKWRDVCGVFKVDASLTANAVIDAVKEQAHAKYESAVEDAKKLHKLCAKYKQTVANATTEVLELAVIASAFSAAPDSNMGQAVKGLCSRAFKQLLLGGEPVYVNGLAVYTKV